MIYYFSGWAWARPTACRGGLTTLNKENAAGFHCPRWDELPAISLYMDQVILVLDESIGLFSDDGKERVVTSTMINNYVKHKLISPPDKKKYNRGHLALLVVVSVMKRVLTMNEITVVVDMMVEEYGIEAAYDLFGRRLEETLAAFFGSGGKAGFDPAAGNEAEAMLGAALTALGGKLYLQYCLGQYAPAQAVPEGAPKEKKAKEKKA